MSSARDATAAVELVFWPLSLLAAALVVAKHGQQGNKSWLPACVPLVILGILWFAGLELSESRGSAILDDVAVTHLLLVLIGLLLRM
ncbi:hypothetical protein F5X99DRAFT_373390 [Biscogniauxia marginata]|nr:hypothetical protein F5X99DRAFT_373390 [Biscogniauxia marginata]